MKLTILKRLKLCYEILTTRSKYQHTFEKELPIFQKGYMAGLKDGAYKVKPDAY